MSNKRKIKRPARVCPCPDCRAKNRAARRGRRLPDRVVIPAGDRRKTGA